MNIENELLESRKMTTEDSVQSTPELIEEIFCVIDNIKQQYLLKLY